MPPSGVVVVRNGRGWKREKAKDGNNAGMNGEDDSRSKRREFLV